MVSVTFQQWQISIENELPFILDLPFHYLRNTEAHQQFRVISKNGSLAAYNGFEVDEAAPISIMVAGEIIVKNGTTKYDDILLYLRSIEVEFGEKLQKPFKVFDAFDGTKNLLFPVSILFSVIVFSLSHNMTSFQY